MSRLIDADKLLEVLNKKRVPFNANVNDAILTAPTVDAVEVIRCKYCKHQKVEFYAAEDNTFFSINRCKYVGSAFGDYDFCSCGERKEE